LPPRGRASGAHHDRRHDQRQGLISTQPASTIGVIARWFSGGSSEVLNHFWFVAYAITL
jgi:hypothetical protein